MTPEEYQKLKEAEKAHLRKIRELKKAQRSSSRKASVTNAVTGMASKMEELFSEHGEMVERLQMDSAMSEARMEVALDSVEANDSVSEAQDAAELAAAEAELKRSRARDLINQMKQSDLKSSDSPASASGSAKNSTEGSTEGSTKGPENTEGASEKETSLPEKTIGRMKP